MGVHTPGNPVLCLPVSPPLPACAASTTPPWYIEQCCSGGHLISPMASTYHIRDILGGGCCPTPTLSRFPTRASAGSTRIVPSLLLPYPDTPQLGNPEALSHSERKSNIFAVLPQGGGCSGVSHWSPIPTPLLLSFSFVCVNSTPVCSLMGLFLKFLFFILHNLFV